MSSPMKNGAHLYLPFSIYFFLAGAAAGARSHPSRLISRVVVGRKGGSVYMETAMKYYMFIFLSHPVIQGCSDVTLKIFYIKNIIKCIRKNKIFDKIEGETCFFF